MTYFPAMMGTIDASNFNSTKYPGICKPMNRETLDQVVEMQNQLNRVAQNKGIAKIAPDGDVGPGTVGLVNKVKEIVLDLATDTSTCMGVAMNADLIASNAKMFADTAGVSATVSAPIPPRPPSFIAPTGLEVPVPGAGSGGMNTTMLILGLGAVGLGFFLLMNRPERKARKRERRAQAEFDKGLRGAMEMLSAPRPRRSTRPR